MTDKKAEYAKCIGLWDEVFAREVSAFPKVAKTGIEEFDKGLAWLADGSESVVDFGCGNGALLFICRNLGTKMHSRAPETVNDIISNQQKHGGREINTSLPPFLFFAFM